MSKLASSPLLSLRHSRNRVREAGPTINKPQAGTPKSTAAAPSAKKKPTSATQAKPTQKSRSHRLSSAQKLPASAPHASGLRRLRHVEAHGAPASAGPHSAGLRRSRSLRSQTQRRRRRLAGLAGRRIRALHSIAISPKPSIPSAAPSLTPATSAITSPTISPPRISQADALPKPSPRSAPSTKLFLSLLLARDAHVLYASALLTDNRPKDAIALARKRPRAHPLRSGTGPRPCLRRHRRLVRKR